MPSCHETNKRDAGSAMFYSWIATTNVGTTCNIPVYTFQFNAPSWAAAPPPPGGTTFHISCIAVECKERGLVGKGGGIYYYDMNAWK